ncbi:CD151 antigen-like [Xenia sp. Carnegie-2017]|uniref:CD151 antigen-like n=1 Tax=Xenia sp. Carnegie-2017 TaxID=2897299 RepID=UPI001F03B23C|nr:CD151 antigen-like [Xenia sp. Carnegie-2017]
MMSLIVILEIASFIIALVYRMKLKDDLRGDMISSIEEYGKDDQEGITKGWDWMQQKFECCGVNDSLDWARYYEKANGSHRIVPDSCCVTEKKDCGNPYRNADHSIKHKIYNKGCFNELEDFLKYNLLTIGIIAAVLVVIELVAIILAFLLITHIKEAGEFV